MTNSVFGQSIAMMAMSAAMFIAARTHASPRARLVTLILGCASLTWLIVLFVIGVVIPRIT